MLPPLVMLLTDFSGLHSPACKAFARLAACRRAWYASFCCAESRCAQVSTQMSIGLASLLKDRGMRRDGGRASFIHLQAEVHAHGGTLAHHAHARTSSTIDVMIDDLVCMERRGSQKRAGGHLREGAPSLLGRAAELLQAGHASECHPLGRPRVLSPRPRRRRRPRIRTLECVVLV